MHQSEYAIAAIVDSAGRIAVCSELINNCSLINKYSLSIEKYIGLGVDPKEALLEKLHEQLGVPIKDVEKIEVVDSGEIRYQLPSIGIRLIHTFVFQFKHPITMKIRKPKVNPIEFIAIDGVIEVFDNSLLQLSVCAEKMLSNLKLKRYHALYKTLNPD